MTFIHYKINDSFHPNKKISGAKFTFYHTTDFAAVENKSNFIFIFVGKYVLIFLLFSALKTVKKLFVTLFIHYKLFVRE